MAFPLLDASTPARWTGTDNTPSGDSSAAFTAPTDAFLVVVAKFDTDATPGAETVDCTDSGGLTWTRQVERTGAESTAGGAVAIFTARTVSSVSRTVKLTYNPTGTVDAATGRKDGVCFVFTGVDVNGTPVDSVTASNEGGSGTDNISTTSLTPGADGVLVVGATEWNAQGACTSSDLKGIDSIAGSGHAEYTSALDVLDGWKTCTSGVGVTGNLNSGGASPQWKWCQIIVRAPGGGGGGRVTKNRISPEGTWGMNLGNANGENW